MSFLVWFSDRLIGLYVCFSMWFSCIFFPMGKKDVLPLISLAIITDTSNSKGILFSIIE